MAKYDVERVWESLHQMSFVELRSVAERIHDYTETNSMIEGFPPSAELMTLLADVAADVVNEARQAKAAKEQAA
jgi:hypothetical protein